MTLLLLLFEKAINFANNLQNNFMYYREETSGLAGRFSKSSSERERILHKRKEQMVQQARKKYIDRQKRVPFHPECTES